jgi:hypothetical protein
MTPSIEASGPDGFRHRPQLAGDLVKERRNGKAGFALRSIPGCPEEIADVQRQVV